MTLPQVPETPTWRGRLHQAAFFVSVPAGIVLVLAARSTTARIAAIVYSLSLAAMFGASAAYHRLPWSPRSRRRMKRLDHSMIFVLIAGTYTPMALLVLRGAFAIVLLCLVWVGALAGIALKVLKIDGLKAVSGALYIALGWLAILATPQFVHGLSAPALGLLFAGGILFTTGAIVLATHRPDPSPRVFGYHEVWHSMVVCACFCHYVLILLVLQSFR
jgi:hemolysin III